MMRETYFPIMASSTNDELEMILKGLSYQEIFHQFTTGAVNERRGVNTMSNEYPTMSVCDHNQTAPTNCLRANELAQETQTKKDSQTTNMANDKRKRTLFTTFQLSRMEEEFNQNMYVVGLKRWRLATELCLTEKQVKIWFQNRRMKLKREQVKTKCLSSGFPWY